MFHGLSHHANSVHIVYDGPRKEEMQEFLDFMYEIRKQNPNMIFTGDTIFSSTWGRTDLPTGSMEDIMDSITQKILILPENTIIYPGHGRSTIVKDEKPIYFELRKKDF